MQNILLIDCDNFFASCEQVLNPELAGKPVCVLSNNDGCVVARSNEAKNLGVPMGIPYFMAVKKFKKVIFVSGRRREYSKISKNVMKILSDFTPSVEQYSIDEAFLDIKGCEKLFKMTPVEIAAEIRKRIKEEIGINVSIGVSKTKTLSKIASEIAKKKVRLNIKDKYEGVFEINKSNKDEILINTPIEDIWGIGRNLHKFFRKHNIKNAYEYSNLDNDFLQRNLGKRGLDLKEELNEIVKYPVIDYYVPPKSVSRTSSFKEFTTSKDFILNELNNHLHEVCIQLRKHKLAASTISVMLRTKDFRVIGDKFNFETPKISEFELYKKMHEIFKILYKNEVLYRSSGVTVSKLCPVEEFQLGLFEDIEAKKKRKLSDAWDKIEQKFGYGAISIGIKKED